MAPESSHAFSVLVDCSGGLDSFLHALQSTNRSYHVVGCCEINPHCQKLHQVLYGECRFFSDINTRDLVQTPACDLYCASPPCQPWSIAGLQEGFRDPRSLPFLKCVSYINQKKPKMFIIENVQGLVSTRNGQDLRYILSQLKRSGDYVIKWEVLNAVDYGLPQQRKRILIIGVLKRHLKADFHFPKPQPLQLQLADIIDARNQQECELTDCDRQKIAMWKSKMQKRGIVLDRYDFVANLARQFNTVYPALGCSPCITTSCSRYYLFRQKRMLTLEELLRLQGFEHVPWPDSISKTERYNMVGSSIPTTMLLAVFEEILPCVSLDKPVSPKLSRQWDALAAHEPAEASDDEDGDMDDSRFIQRILAKGLDKDGTMCYLVHHSGTPLSEADWIRKEGLDADLIQQFADAPLVTDKCYLCEERHRKTWQYKCSVCTRMYHSTCLAAQGIRITKSHVDAKWLCPQCQSIEGTTDAPAYTPIVKLLAKGKDSDGTWTYLTRFVDTPPGKEEWIREEGLPPQVVERYCGVPELRFDICDVCKGRPGSTYRLRCSCCCRLYHLHCLTTSKEEIAALKQVGKDWCCAQCCPEPPDDISKHKHRCNEEHGQQQDPQRERWKGHTLSEPHQLHHAQKRKQKADDHDDDDEEQEQEQGSKPRSKGAQEGILQQGEHPNQQQRQVTQKSMSSREARQYRREQFKQRKEQDYEEQRENKAAQEDRPQKRDHCIQPRQKSTNSQEARHQNREQCRGHQEGADTQYTENPQRAQCRKREQQQHSNDQVARALRHNKRLHHKRQQQEEEAEERQEQGRQKIGVTATTADKRRKLAVLGAARCI